MSLTVVRIGLPRITPCRPRSRISLESELNWSRSQVTSGVSLVAIAAVVASPFVGMAVDRFGPRRIALFGLTIYCASYAALGTATKSLWHWWLLWAAVASGAIFIKPVVWMAAVTDRFRKRPGLAIGLTLSGAGLAAAVLPPLANWLIGSNSWRFAFFALGVGGAVVSLPMVLAFFHQRPRIEAKVELKVCELDGPSIRGAMRSQFFVRLAIASGLVSTGVVALAVHFVPIMVSHGIPAQAATLDASYIGVASIIGRVGTGFVLDRLPGHIVGAVALALPAFSCLLLLGGTSQATSVLCAIVIGISVGSELDIVAYLCSREFGQQNFGALFGTMAGIIALGIGVGPTIAGAVFDAFHSYSPLFWALLPCFVIGAVLIGTLGNLQPLNSPKSKLSFPTEPQGGTL